MPPETIQLSKQNPFSKGGNRLCFVHPDDPHCCLKVFQERGRPEQRRARKGFLGRFRPLSSFDENLQEYLALQDFHSHFPGEITRHLPQTHGMVDTDLGPAHAMELIRDQDGKISQTLEQYIWQHGIDDRLSLALESFKADWQKNAPTTRELLPHNLLVQISETATLFLIDGYGRKKHFQRLLFKNTSSKRRLTQLNQRINIVLKNRNQKKPPKPRIHQIDRSK